MGKHEHNVVCPACGGGIGADTQAELIKMVQDHAKTAHQMDLTAEKVLEMEKAQTKK
jgi:predicted small metal-binding protein